MVTPISLEGARRVVELSRSNPIDKERSRVVDGENFVFPSESYWTRADALSEREEIARMALMLFPSYAARLEHLRQAASFGSNRATGPRHVYGSRSTLQRAFRAALAEISPADREQVLTMREWARAAIGNTKRLSMAAKLAHWFRDAGLCTSEIANLFIALGVDEARPEFSRAGDDLVGSGRKGLRDRIRKLRRVAKPRERKTR